MLEGEGHESRGQVEPNLRNPEFRILENQTVLASNSDGSPRHHHGTDGTENSPLLCSRGILVQNEER